MFSLLFSFFRFFMSYYSLTGNGWNYCTLLFFYFLLLIFTMKTVIHFFSNLNIVTVEMCFVLRLVIIYRINYKNGIEITKVSIYSVFFNHFVIHVYFLIREFINELELLQGIFFVRCNYIFLKITKRSQSGTKKDNNSQPEIMIPLLRLHVIFINGIDYSFLPACHYMWCLYRSLFCIHYFAYV